MRIEKVNIKKVFVNGESVRDYLIGLYGDNLLYGYWNYNISKLLYKNLQKLKVIKFAWWIDKKFTILEHKGVTIILKESNSFKPNIKAYYFDREHLRNVMKELEGV